MTQHDAPAQTAWTPWLSLDDMAPVLAIGTDQTYDDLSHTLVHLEELGLLQWGQDDDGALHFRVRMDQAGRAAAWLDDEAYARRN